MKRTKHYDEDEPSDQARIVPDFLPPPEKLIVPKDPQTKITLVLDVASVAFFKEAARRTGTKYQRMMREVLRRYAYHHATRHAA